VKPSAFACHDPRNSDDLMALLAKLDHARLLARGQFLMPMLNLEWVNTTKT
jgi:CO/xanthine dehydrogenase FAD-binding subunit